MVPQGKIFSPSLICTLILFISPLKYFIAPLSLTFVSSVTPVISKLNTFDFFSLKLVISFAIIVVFSPSLMLNLPLTKTMFSSIKLAPDLIYVFSNA